MEFQLVPIDRSGMPAGATFQLDDLTKEVCAQTASSYESSGFVSPWLGYLAESTAGVVGTCGFKAPPTGGEVEIAYFTYPQYEGRGLATAMVRALVDLARAADPAITVTAQTLRQRSASTRILEKLGFRLRAELVHPVDGEIWEWELPDGIEGDDERRR